MMFYIMVFYILLTERFFVNFLNLKLIVTKIKL